MSKKKTQVPTIRSSAAEYLTFVAAVGDSESSIEMRYEDENIWLTQKMMATLYDVSVAAVNQHLKRIFGDNELERAATIKPCLIVQTEGNRQVQREIDHYNLQAIIAVGFKIENERAVQFRKWANQIVKDYTIQGWTMDVERLKKGGSVLDNEYFDRQLEKSCSRRDQSINSCTPSSSLRASCSINMPSAKLRCARFFQAISSPPGGSVVGIVLEPIIANSQRRFADSCGFVQRSRCVCRQKLPFRI